MGDKKSLIKISIFVAIILAAAGIAISYFWLIFKEKPVSKPEEPPKEKVKVVTNVGEREVEGKIKKYQKDQLTTEIYGMEIILILKSESKLPDLSNSEGRNFKAVVNQNNEIISLELK